MQRARNSLVLRSSSEVGAGTERPGLAKRFGSGSGHGSLLPYGKLREVSCSGHGAAWLCEVVRKWGRARPAFEKMRAPARMTIAEAPEKGYDDIIETTKVDMKGAKRMQWYVDVHAGIHGDGSREKPFRSIADAALVLDGHA